MYKNVAFDLGGVTVEYDPQQFLLARFCNAEMEKKVYDIVFNSEEWKKLDAGEMTRPTAEAIMMEKAAQQDCVYELQSVLDDWMYMMKPVRRTVDVLRRLKKMGFHVYYLSNISETALAYLRRQEFFSLFDGGVASCEEHLCKPNPRIFELLLDRYQLAKEELIFVDDTKENVTAAYNIGITGIHYKSSATFLKAMNTCGIPLKEGLGL